MIREKLKVCRNFRHNIEAPTESDFKPDEERTNTWNRVSREFYIITNVKKPGIASKGSRYPEAMIGLRHNGFRTVEGTLTDYD